MKIVDLYPDGDDSYKPSSKGGNWDFEPKYIIWILGIVIVIYLLSGIYVVNPDERAVVKRFGAYVGEVGEGLHYHLPWPIETVLRDKVTEIKRIEIGFRTIDPGPPAHYQDIPEESLMLTADENIISVDMVVQYKIKSLGDYLFNVENPERTLKKASEAALRQVIGKTDFDTAITTGKNQIQLATHNLLQKISDSYKMGIKIINVKLQDVHPPQQVMTAFKDVSSAREDSNRYVNEGKAYYNDVVPQAQGQAYEIIEQAKAYKQSIINEAQGEAQRFLKIYGMYKKYPKITRLRLYFEAMDKILKKSDFWIVDNQLVKILEKWKKAYNGGNRNEQ